MQSGVTEASPALNGLGPGSNPGSATGRQVKYNFTEAEIALAVARSRNYSEAMRLLGMPVAGGNHATFKKLVRASAVDTHHFETHSARARRTLRGRHQGRPNAEVFRAGSRHTGAALKKRMFALGVKEECCLCGQDENWRGKKFTLILDHIDGDNTNNRLENLRIVCPNCNATLDTHCGKNYHKKKPARPYDHGRGKPRASRRKVVRPEREEVVAFIEKHGYSAAGREYGVSDNAVRKWIKSDTW